MRFFLSILVFLLCIPFVLGSSLNIFHESYAPGETVQALIEGETVISGSITLLDGSSQAVSVTSLFTEYKEGFTLLYFNLPSTITEGNYTLVVGSLQGNFSVVFSSPVLQIKRGIIVLSSTSTSFSVVVSSLGEGGTVLVSASDSVLKPRKSSLSLGSDDTKTLYVDYTYGYVVEDMTLTFNYGEDKSYVIPVIYPGYVVEEVVNETENVMETNMDVEINVLDEELVPFLFLVTKTKVDISLRENESLYGDLKVQNLLNETLYNLTYSLTGDLDLIVVLNETVISLAPGNVYSQRIWFNLKNNSRIGEYSGFIFLTYENGYSQNISFLINVISSESEAVFVEENVLENQTIDEYVINYEGNTLSKESSGNGIYYLGIFMSVLLIALIVLVVLKLRQKEDRKFNEYIKLTKKK